MRGKIKYLIVVLVVLQGFLLFMYMLCYQGKDHPSGASLVHESTRRTDIFNHSVIKQTIKPEQPKRTSRRQDVGVSILNKTNTILKERNRECQGTIFQPELGDESSWFPVDKAGTIFVYAAYYIKARRKVFIISVKRRQTSSCICQYWYPDGSNGTMRMTEHPAVARMKMEGKSKP